MAITNADGSIILSTKVDVSGTRKGLREIVNSARQTGSQTKSALEPLTAIIQKQQERLNALNSEYAELIINGKRNSTEAKKLRKQIDALSKEMKENQAVASAMGAQGTTAIQKMGVAVKTLLGYFIGLQTVMAVINFSGEASKLATQTEASVQRLVDIYGNSANAVGDFIDKNALALGMSKASASAFSAVYGNLFSVWADQSTNAELTNQYLEMTAVIASKTGGTVEDVQERIRSGLLGNTEAIEDLGVFVNVKTIEMTDAFKRMADGKSWEQLDTYTQQQIRTMAILEQATEKYGNEVADTSSLARSQFKASYEDFQATWGQVVNTVLIPILQVATQILNIFTLGLQSLFNLSGGILGDEVIEQQKASYNQQKKITEETENTGEALKDYTAGFDELNTIQKDSGSKDNDFSNNFNVSKKEAQDTSKNTKKISKDIQKTLLSIMGVVATALVAVGIILCATGNLAWGIGFIIAGAGLLGVTMATLKSNAISKEVKDALSNVIIIAGIVAVIIGILCCIAQQWAIGIGLIVLGVSSMGFSISLNWNGIKEKIETHFGGILYIIGAVAIVIGILCCFAQMWAVGIGLIVTGALAVGTTVAVHWDAIKTATVNAFNAVMDWVKTWGLLVLGIILLMSGVSAPLGIALIYKGAKNLTEAKDPKWTWLLDKVKTVWKSVQDYWNSHIAKYFTKEWWGNLAKNAINGFLKWIVNGLNKLIDKLNSFSFSLPSVLGGGTVGFNVKRLEVPQLAKGAVIPANKPFLAMLGDQKSGTNIETPLDTMVEAFNIALSNNQNSFNGTIEIPVTIDGREILRVVRNNENAVGTQTVFGGFANAY